MITGWKKLTKEEQHHVTTDAGCLNSLQWLSNITFQKEINKTQGKPACPHCWIIAHKLGQVE